MAGPAKRVATERKSKTSVDKATDLEHGETDTTTAPGEERPNERLHRKRADDQETE
jgi:hypothetical protein